MKPSFSSTLEAEHLHYFYELSDSFCSEDFQNLREYFSNITKSKWIDWLELHHDEIINLIKSLPDSLNQNPSLLLKCASLLYLIRARNFAKVLAVASPVVDGRVPLSLWAEYAETYSDLVHEPLYWVLDEKEPFQETEDKHTQA